MNIKEAARLTGLSVRTLQHYDNIGLLVPERNSENDYRIYSAEDMAKLQQILLFRECGLPLEQIGNILSHPSYSREDALAMQREYLLGEKRRIEAMLKTLDHTLDALKGGKEMTAEEQFEGFKFTRDNPYEEEARQRWGDEAVDKSNAYIQSKSDKDMSDIQEKMNAMFAGLAELRDTDPAGDVAQEAMEQMYNFMNGSFGVKYSYEAFAGLGAMYIADSRFQENIDRFGPGLAEFLSKAMDIYGKNHS